MLHKYLDKGEGKMNKIPGFRTNTLWKKVLATFGYLIIFLTIISAVNGNENDKSSPTSAPVNQSQQSNENKLTDQNSEVITQKSEKDTIPTTIVPGQKVKISYIDVGQADSILIQIPNGKNILIDAGNNEDANTITSYIKKQNISKLDIVIGTHPHEDHIGSLDTIINTFDIGQVIMPKKDSTTQTYKDVITSIQNKGLKITEAKAGLKLDLGAEVNALLIAPNSTSYDDVNNYSAVLKLSYGTNTFLFEGDAQEQSENEMINAGYNLKADALKVGHHGSHTSSTPTFLAKVEPSYSIISVGKDNSYGHPAQTTIDNLTKIGTKIYRTDQSGTIIIESDGKNITVNTISTEIQPRAPSTSVTQPSQSTGTTTVVPVPTPKPTQNVTVYITKTGSKYHRDGCRYLSKSQIPIPLSQAKLSYSPCSVCNPPR